MLSAELAARLALIIRINAVIVIITPDTASVVKKAFMLFFKINTPDLK